MPDIPKPELRVVMSQPAWVLETQLRSSARAMCTLNNQAISAAPQAWSFPLTTGIQRLALHCKSGNICILFCSEEHEILIEKRNSPGE